MKFSVRNNRRENIADLMRQLRYHYYGSGRDRTEMSFVRPLGGAYYPQFHIFLKENRGAQEINFNLHLDQRAPVYKGTTAHSGEYESTVVEKEAERIKDFFFRHQND